MKSQDEVQRAHDKMVALLTNRRLRENLMGLQEKHDQIFSMCLNVLDWILEVNDHKFQTVLDGIDQAAAEAGLRLKRRDETQEHQ